MPSQKIDSFTGVYPIVSRRLLQNGQAQQAINVRLTGGNLNPVYGPLVINAGLVSNTPASIYRMYDREGNSFWLSWDADTDAVRGPVGGDETFRTYFTSVAFEPRVTDIDLATTLTPYPAAWYVLGVTPPTTAPTINHTGGAASNETRTYVYTFVTQWGEESYPSPSGTIHTAPSDATWNITGMDTAPGNSYNITNATWAAGVLTCTVSTTFGLRAGEYVTISGLAPSVLNASWPVATVPSSTTFTVEMDNPGTITDTSGTATRDAPHNTTGMTKRVYRSVTSSTDTDFFYVGEVAVATTSFNDTSSVVIGEPLATSTWVMPPVDLQGVKSLPSGSLVGFRKNEVCISEPLAPYAWPVAYRLTTEFDIVGLGVVGNSIVVCTEGYPYTADGVDPTALTLTKVPQYWSCTSKRGIADVDSGVVFPTPLGLAMIGVGGSQLLTRNFYSQSEWSQLDLDTFVSAVYDNKYYAVMGTSVSSGRMLVFDTTYNILSFTDRWGTAAFTDRETGYAYFVFGGSIAQWDADRSYRLQFTWQSKEFQVPAPVNIAAAKIDADFGTTDAEQAALLTAQAAQAAANQAEITALTTAGSFNGAALNSYSFNGSSIMDSTMVGDGGLRSVIFQLFSNGTLVHEQTVYTNTPFRLPGGSKYDVFDVVLSGNVPVFQLTLGESVRSLAAI